VPEVQPLPRRKEVALADKPTPKLRVWLVKTALLVAMVAAFLAGVIWLGNWGLEQIRSKDRFVVPFSEIECTPPPGQTRGEFLDEVLYLARLPDRVGFLDDDLPQKLSVAFAKHPWVEKVSAVERKPPRTIQVRLVLRRPVLAVPTAEGLVVVDAQGVCLPKNAPTEGLPVYEGEATLPRGPAGKKWGDPKVEERARQAAAP
jgi:hypothetical protein